MNRVRGPAPRRPHAGLRCLVAFLALALATLGSAPAAAASADEQVRALGQAFVLRLSERSPDQASLVGSHDHDDKLVPVTQSSLAEDRDFYRDLAHRLDGIPARGLSPARARERDLLAAYATRRAAELELLRPFERDPAAYLPLIAGSVRSVLERSASSPCGRTRNAAHRLALVPEVLRAARINLSAAPAALIEIAIPRLEGVLRFYRETVPAMAVNCRDGRMQADLAEADTTAVRAVEAFIRDLRETAQHATGPLALGPEACQRWLDAGLGEHVPLDSLRAEAGRAIDAARAAAATPEPAVALDRSRVEDAVRRVTSFVVQRELLTVRPGIGAIVRDAPAYAVEPLALDVPGAWEYRSNQIWLDVASDTAEVPAEGRRAPSVSAADVDLLAFRETLPGALARYETALGAPTRLIRMLLAAAPDDAWDGFAERLAIDAGYGGGEAAMAGAAARSALRRHGRTLAALEIHAGAMSLDQAVRMLVERCGLGEDVAAYEARMAACDPAAMGYTHAVSSLVALRDDAQRRLGARFRVRDFVDAALREGGFPIGRVRAGLTRSLLDASGAAP